MLKRQGRVWRLVYAGHPGTFKHEKGAEYVARVLAADGPLQAVELANPGDMSAGKPKLEARLADVLELGARVQERSVALDEQEERKRLIQQRRRLEALAADETASKAVREGAARDAEAISEYLHRQPKRPTDNAQKTVRAVRMAIKRFCRNLEGAMGENRKPDRVLREFGAHIWGHLIVPSSRYSDPRARHARKGLAGCFLYEAPKGVRWILEF